MDKVDEKTTAYLTITPMDKDGTPVAPTSISYKIFDAESGAEVRAATVISPATVMEIKLDKNDNTLVDPTNAEETRRVTVSAVYGADDELHGVYRYGVVNVPGV